jgi:hypothetical protein
MPESEEVMYPSWIDPVTQLRLSRERASELRSDWRNANGRGAMRSEGTVEPCDEQDGRLTRFVRQISGLVGRVTMTADDPC